MTLIAQSWGFVEVDVGGAIVAKIAIFASAVSGFR